MAIFKGRYLCCFCAAFLLSAFLTRELSHVVQIIIISVLLLFTVTALIFAIVLKPHRFKLFVALLCIASAGIGAFNSFWFIAMPYENAESYSGEGTVQVKILRLEYLSTDEEQYSVRIEKIDNESTDIKGRLYISGENELSYGDRLIANAEIGQSAELYASGELLTIFIEEDSKIYIQPSSPESFLSLDGIRGMSGRLQKLFGSYVNSLYSEDARGLVKGFLINDKSDIPMNIQRAFRRSGTSHLLAVSGLHIALLLGSLELLQRKLFVHKRIRCAVVAAAGIFFIALTDFSPSAIRSLLMLFAVYLSFFFAEDGDTLTALLASVALIVLFSPYSVFDVGMWMSFFATLGLVTLYPYIEARFPKKKPEKRIKRLFFTVGIYLLRGVCITLVANFFLLPIFWIYFGEMSLVSVPANLVLSPLSSLYMPMCAVSLIVGKIPILGGVICFAVEHLGMAISFFATLFAKIPWAVISLKYPFAGILVAIFAVSLTALLIAELKRKWLVFVPPVAFVLCFCACLGVFNITYKERLDRVEWGKNEIWIYSNADEVAVLDICDGGAFSRYKLLSGLPKHTTEIDSYVIKSVRNGHSYLFEELSQSFYIRELYLPKSTNAAEAEEIARIYTIAEQYGSKIIFYEQGSEKDAFSEACKK